MKTTGLLHVMNNAKQPEHDVIIHPNDGYELGLMSRFHSFTIIPNSAADQKINKKECFQGHLLLENKCKMGTIELAVKLWKRLGKPLKVFLIQKDDTLLIMQK